MCRTIQSLGLILLLSILAGCTSGVSRTKAPAKAIHAWSQDNPLSNLKLVMTEEGKESIKDNLKFNPDALKDHVQRALAANSLLVEDKKGLSPNIVVEVKNVRVRTNFSAVMWGFMAGDDHITGDIVIQDNNGMELDRFEVSVAYALGGLAGGMDSARMGWLYETFAEETVKELTKKSPQNTVYIKPQEKPKPTIEEFDHEPSMTTAPIGSEDLNNMNRDSDFKVNDLVLLKLTDGNSEIITITEITDSHVAGYYDYEGGQYQVSDIWSRSDIVGMKRVRASEVTRTNEPIQPKPEDVFKSGDVIILEFKDGATKEIILTHMNDRVIAAHYQYDNGHTTPVNFDRRNVRRISYANKGPNKTYDWGGD